MMAEDWLYSRVKLCPLITGPNVDLSTFQDPVKVIIISESCQPHYNSSSLLLTLEAFTGALDELQGRRSVVKVNYVDQNASGPKPVQTDVIYHFAEMLTEDILDAAVRKQDPQSIKDGHLIRNITQGEASRWTVTEHEKLANRLATEIFSNALEELTRSGCPVGRKSEGPDVIQATQKYENEIVSEIHSEPASYLSTSIHPYIQEGSVMEIDNIYDRRSTSNPITLDHMAHLGSLDYPDAPPSTPLLPEMMKSRSSFTRKLKGGLAKEFIPSTPPPTPKEQQLLLEDRMTDSAVDKSEFMVGLMHSLSLACTQLGEENGTMNESRIHSEISDYAAQLSSDIIHCITAVQGGCNRTIETPVRVVANHLAEEIVMEAIAEVIRKGSVHERSQEIPPYCENATQNLNDVLVSETTQDIPPLDTLRAMAGGLINDTLVQVFSELQSASLQCTMNRQLPDPSSEAMPWEHENDEYLNTDSPIIPSYQTYTGGCSNFKSGLNYIPLDSATAEHIFNENIVQEVLKFSMREASACHLRCKETSVHSEGTSSLVPSQPVLRAFISETLCYDIQELQCVLLWAAASQMGTSTLQIDLNQKHIQQQLCRVSLQAQFHDWTVGHLMTSLLQYCEDQQMASRGHSKISTSLLGHLS